MSVPATRLTAKFSDPVATAVSWAETRRALEEAELFWISTVRADGQASRDAARGGLGRRCNVVHHGRR